MPFMTCFFLLLLLPWRFGWCVCRTQLELMNNDDVGGNGGSGGWSQMDVLCQFFGAILSLHTQFGLESNLLYDHCYYYFKSIFVFAINAGNTHKKVCNDSHQMVSKAICNEAYAGFAFYIILCVWILCGACAKCSKFYSSLNINSIRKQITESKRTDYM